MKAGLDGVFGGNQPAKKVVSESAPTESIIAGTEATLEGLREKVSDRIVEVPESRTAEDGTYELRPENQEDLRNLLAEIKRREGRDGLTLR